MAEVIVIGAGLVGTVAAMYLVKLGHEVKVFEKRSDPRQSGRPEGSSVNLTLCERGFASLAQVGLDETLRQQSVPIYGRLIHDPAGEQIFQPYGTVDQAIYSITRTELHRILLDHAEREFRIKFVFCSTCVTLDARCPSITVRSGNSQAPSEERADVVFGADGVHSVIRSHLLRQGLIACDGTELEQGYKELDLPAAGGRDWFASQNALHLWPRDTYMLIAFPNMDGSFTGAIHLPFHGDVSFDSLQAPDDLLHLFRESFPDALPYIQDLGETFFARPVNRMTSIRCSPWHAGGKVILLGDAAHALYPVYGQGANAGFEDCRILNECLGDSGDDWSGAFECYSRIRQRDLNAMTALCNSHTIELRKHAADQSFQLRKAVERKVAEVLGARYRSLYEMIAFSLTSYADAVEASVKQEALIDRLMLIENLEGKLRSGEFDRIVQAEAMSFAEMGARSGSDSPC
jgi:kynurenine 3-monooxygenase